MRAIVIMLLGLALAAPCAHVAQADGCCCTGNGPEATELATVVFHLPLAFNDGAPVPETLLEDLLVDVVEIAGGFTYYEATGGWMFEGRLYREPVWVVKVGLQPEQVDGLEELVEKRLKTDFKQEAVWVEESGMAEIR